MNYYHQKEKLAKIANRLAKKYREKLEQLKQEHKELKRPDFIWHFLIQSFSTMGRAAGWHGLVGNKENYSKVTFDALAKLDPLQRENVVRSTCRVAKIRMPDKKAEFILGCFEHIKKMGGLEKANGLLHAASGREEKIKFLMSFPGIGPKYARNIMMDVYHEDFRNSIAIDIRIKAISSALGVAFNSYAEHEKFYLECAKLAGINGWELDRLLFNFRSEFENEIAAAG
ncbi:hypothetical protein [Chitinimonas taiwanensis]|uniref:Uncharacterized protein n=1 Tax=Chitinimonas taiwanensis DSM 18899 TaxID=1121279 RepID=A0A1K2H6E2_9NEIS|nr:hypothetical protein [Chitinimonas taiwanensis]SFZ71854.1 hypothetical protein SAMN02745887_00473 [Chitinimonas taiwanensis DSM 18899]